MANKDAHHSVSDRTTMNPSYYIRMAIFIYPAVVETSPMMPADYREEVSHQFNWTGRRQRGHPCYQHNTGEHSTSFSSCSIDYSIEEKVPTCGE